MRRPLKQQNPYNGFGMHKCFKDLINKIKLNFMFMIFKFHTKKRTEYQWRWYILKFGL